jgi:hypothetical protein
MRPVSSFKTGRLRGRMMEEIERLELRIEELREAIERSRRLRLAGRASAVIGPALLAGFALGLVDYAPTRMIVALALAIGGVVLTGSLGGHGSHVFIGVVDALAALYSAAQASK